MVDVVVAGAMAQRPGRAGHAWVFLNWMFGFQRSGHRVLFLDRVSPDLGPVDSGVRWVRHVMSSAGFEDAWAVLLASGYSVGLNRRRLVERLTGSILINVMGYLTDEDLLALPDRRVFLDIDPGFGQSWQQAGLAKIFVGHDDYATVGLNVGRPGCRVPHLGLDWIATLPPVDLDRWACPSSPTGRLTTIGSWRGPFAPVDVDGVTYGLRAHAARALADLPARVGLSLEVALDIDETDAADRGLLEDGGWSLRSPDDVAADLDEYRTYIHGSLGEFSVAKQAYVGLATGWFSDRSACYLASGRPAIVTDTGLADHLPLGVGLLAYRTPDEAAGAIAAVVAEPRRHGQAAQELARDRFAAAAVAQRLLEQVA